MKMTIMMAEACVLLLATAPIRAAAETVAGKDATPVIEHVSLFKNGLGFIQSSVVLPEGASSVRLGQLPIPSHGTFWVEYDKDVPLRKLVTAMEEVDVQTPAQSSAQLLLLNPGRPVVVHTEKGTVKGVVLKPRVSEPLDVPSPYAMGFRREEGFPGRSSPYPSPEALSAVLVQTKKGVVALENGAIERVEFTGGDVVASATIKIRRPVIRVELEKPAGGRKIGLSCLARGVTWVPSYLIDLTDAKTARFTAKAVVVNELADFNQVALDLVTGFPNIKFGDVQGPEAMSQNLEQLLRALASDRDTSSRRGTRNVMSQQAMWSNNSSGSDEEAPAPAYSLAMPGSATEDLFFYPIKDFTLKKGETATVPMFTAEMPYLHIYTWKIDDWLDENDGYRNSRPGSEEGKAAEEVWHCCRLTNPLTMPLTTATAEFVTAGRFTGQDVCYFTAPQRAATIRINRAMNVLAEQAEFEVERKRNAASFYGTSYDQVTVQGELKLSSRLDKAASLEITKEISGDLLESDPKVYDAATAKGLRRVNPRHELTWELELKPGGEQKLIYKYQVYVRN